MPSSHVGSVKTSSLMLSAVLAALVCVTAAKPAKNIKLAKYVPNLCKFSDPMLDKCMTDNVKEILKYAKTGIPELNIPVLEPFIIQELDLTIFRGISSTLLGGGSQRTDKHKSYVRNLKIHHSSEFTMNQLKSNFKNKEFYLDLFFPRFEMEGEYDVNLQMFNMPIKSTGPVYINVTNTLVKATLNGQTIKRKNETYLLFDTISINVDFKDFSVMIENLFKKDQNLNRGINDMIKTQKAELRKLMMPMIEELAGKMVLDMVNKILANLPLEEVFIMD